MATVTKYANANAVVATGWTSPTNAYADDTSYATAAPGKSTSITSDFGFAAFSSSDIADSSAINSVTLEMVYKSSATNSTGAVIGLQLNNNGSLLGSETTWGMNLADQTVTKAETTGISLTDLRNGYVKGRVRGYRGSSNNAVTWSLDYVKITVDYTAPVSVTATPSGVSGAGAVGTVSVTAGTGVTASPSGVAATTAVGTPTVVEGVGVTASPSGVSATGSLGTAEAKAAALTEAAGVSSAGALGESSVTAGATAEAIGVSGETALGAAEAGVWVTVEVSGVAAAGGLGSVVVDASAETTVGGVSSEASLGSPTVTAAANVTPAGVLGGGQIGSGTIFGDALVSGEGAAGITGLGSPTVTTSGEGEVSVITVVSGVVATGALGHVSVATSSSQPQRQLMGGGRLRSDPPVPRVLRPGRVRGTSKGRARVTLERQTVVSRELVLQVRPHQSVSTAVARLSQIHPIHRMAAVRALDVRGVGTSSGRAVLVSAGRDRGAKPSSVTAVRTVAPALEPTKARGESPEEEDEEAVILALLSVSTQAKTGVTQ